MSGQTRSKKSQLRDQADSNTLTKEETQMAKFLRLKCQSKQGNLNGMKIDYFVGSKLVDCLMESKWGPNYSTAKKPTTTTTTETNTNTKNIVNKDAVLGSRAACVALMQRLHNKQLFYRAFKIYKDEQPGSEAVDSSDKTPNLRKRKKEVASGPETTPNTQKSSPDTPNSAKAQQKESKRKFKLELHQDQKFVDSSEPFVWIYDPVSTKTYIIGGLLILGAIGICLFPLWPSQVREGVYYLSLAGATFLGAVLSLALLKYIVYAVVWACTLGKVEFWLFPNLTEDVGFVDSFIPVYKCNCGKTKSIESKKTDETVTSEETVTIENQESLMSGSMTGSMTTRMTRSTTAALANNATITELSKSTVEISGNFTSKDSPLVKTRKHSIKVDEEEFELVDNEDNESAAN